MTESNKSNGSFAQAFLPGLILGLVIGAVAGALLPDLLGGSKIPAPSGQVTPGSPTDRDQIPTQDEAQGIIDDAAGQVGDPMDPAANP